MKWAKAQHQSNSFNCWIFGHRQIQYSRLLGGEFKIPPPRFLSPLFPTPMRIPGSNGAITRATLEVIPRHNTITSNT